jgi:7 transmembrane receptor (Secretin family)
MLPIVLYIFINSILFSIVAYALLCGKTGEQLRSTQTVESQRLSRFAAAFSCFIVLGLTWIFGLFAIGSIRILFQILFCIFATLTGFFIFILYIITSKTKRTCWNGKFIYSILLF